MANDYVTRTILKLEFEGFEEKMDSKLAQLKSDIFDKLDKMAGVQSKEDEEDSAHEFSHKRVNDDLSDLDRGVTVLEKGN